MKQILSSLDIGSDTIKVVVAEYFNQKYNVLASSIVKSEGIKKGLIVNAEKAMISIKKALEDASNMLGVPITKVIASVPSNNARYTLVAGHINLTGDEITGEDLAKVVQLSIYNEVREDEELVTVLPVNFYVDDKIVMDPKGMIGHKLSAKAIMVTTPKKNVYSVISTLESIGVSTVDITLGQVGDYFTLKMKGMETSVGLIVNIGAEKTELGIFNKGILVSSAVLNIGSKSIDNDIRYIYHISNKDAKRLKETFAVSHKRYSQVGEVCEIVLEDGVKVSINQYELSEIITARLTEMLKEIKKEVNSLTNKQISYIMFTGGITELPGIKANIEMVFGSNITLANMNKIGIRDNTYTTAFGLIKMFHEKLVLRDKEYSMFDEFDEENIITTRKSSNNFSSDSVLGKVVGYFFDN